MPRSALASYLVLWPFAPPVSALDVLDPRRAFAVLICRDTMLRTDFRRKQSIRGKFGMRDFGGTNLCEMYTQMGAWSYFP